MPILPLEHPESLAATLGVMLYAGEDDASQKRARAARNLRQAKLRLSQACLEDIEYAPSPQARQAPHPRARHPARGCSAHEMERRDLLEVVEDRDGTRSTILTSQLPVDAWHDHFGDPTVADAICDRILHRAHRIVPQGPSRREEEAPKK